MTESVVFFQTCDECGKAFHPDDRPDLHALRCGQRDIDLFLEAGYRVSAGWVGHDPEGGEGDGEPVTVLSCPHWVDEVEWPL